MRFSQGGVFIIIPTILCAALLPGGVVYTDQTAAAFTAHHSIFLPGYGADMPAVDHCITIGTPFCPADAMPPKRKQKQYNSGNNQQNIQQMQPGMKNDSRDDKARRKKISSPVGLFHSCLSFSNLVDLF